MADLLREAAVGVASSWARVVQADSRRSEAQRLRQDDPGTSPTVEPLTELGLNLNRILVLPVSDRMQRGVFDVDAVLTEFRSAYGDPAVRSKKRGEVGQAIVDFLQLVREEGTV
jgi:hypothetical protein